MLLALATTQETYLPLIAAIINVTLCIFWPVSVAHILVPFIHRMIVKHDPISLSELFGRDVEEYPWSNSEEVQIEWVVEENKGNIQGRSFAEKC